MQDLDDMGNITTVTNSASWERDYTYDDRYRLLTADYDDTTAMTARYEYEYDAGDNLTVSGTDYSTFILGCRAC